MSEALGDWKAALDQMIAGLHDMAVLSAKFHGELVEAGFTREEALSQVLLFQSEQFYGGKSQDG